MRTSAPPLPAIQAWMQAVLVHPGGARAGLLSPEARRHLPPGSVARVVRGRGGLGAAERLEIYAGMYPLRMNEALRADYPALAALLGPRSFGRLVGDYVAAHPSRTFTLARLGDRLPRFVAGWGSARRRGLLSDVARLERAATEAFDAEETPPIDPSALEAVPLAGWPGTKLLPAAAFRLVPVRPGAVDVLDAFLEGRPMPSAAGRGRVAVAYYRKDFVVRRRTLGAVEGSLLAALSAGEALGAALERAARAVPGGLPSGETLSGWFAEWARLGFFARIEAPASSGPA